MAMLCTNLGNEASDSSCLEKCGQTQKWALLPVKRPRSKEGRRIKYVTSDLTLTNLVAGINLKYFNGKEGSIDLEYFIKKKERNIEFKKISLKKRDKIDSKKYFIEKRRKGKFSAFSQSNDHQN